MSIEIRKVDDVPATRPCRYCLGLQDDSVFADFDIDSEGRVFLVRISFDGYGCYEAGERDTRMKPEMSRRWIELVGTDNVGSVEMSAILSQYFRENSDVVWKDALAEHDLLDNWSIVMI